MRVCCVSDLHGHFPDVPEADLLLLAGDYAPACKHRPVFFYRDGLGPWVKAAAGRMPVVAVAGNHDVLFERRPGLVPALPWTDLCVSG